MAGTVKSPKSEIISVDVKIKGEEPLMFNRMPPEVLEQIRTKTKAPKTKPPEDPRDDCVRKLYLDPTDKMGKRPFLPKHMLWASLVGAGTFVRLEGKKMISTAKSTRLPLFLKIDTREMPIKPPHWEVDLRQGRNPNGGEAVALVRPIFYNWAIECRIRIYTNRIGEDVMRELFDVAGSAFGLGEFNPLHKGTYGTFNVACWKRVGSSKKVKARKPVKGRKPVKA